MTSLFSDPLTFWSRVLIRLGLVLGALAVGPAVVDFLFFRGGAVVIATIAIYTLAPLAVLSLALGLALWVWRALRK